MNIRIKKRCSFIQLLLQLMPKDIAYITHQYTGWLVEEIQTALEKMLSTEWDSSLDNFLGILDENKLFSSRSLQIRGFYSTDFRGTYDLTGERPLISHHRKSLSKNDYLVKRSKNIESTAQQEICVSFSFNPSDFMCKPTIKFETFFWLKNFSNGFEFRIYIDNAIEGIVDMSLLHQSLFGDRFSLNCMCGCQE